MTRLRTGSTVAASDVPLKILIAWHLPPAHAPPTQSCPQEPQLVGFVANDVGSTHAPLHDTCDPEQPPESETAPSTPPLLPSLPDVPSAPPPPSSAGPGATAAGSSPTHARRPSAIPVESTAAICQMRIYFFSLSS